MIVPPNDIDDFFFNPWGYKLEEDEATTAVTFNQLANRIEITIQAAQDMTIDTNDIIRSIWPIHNLIQAYRFLEPRKTQRPVTEDKYKIFNMIAHGIDIPIEKLRVGNISLNNQKQFDQLIKEYANIFN